MPAGTMNPDPQLSRFESIGLFCMERARADHQRQGTLHTGQFKGIHSARIQGNRPGPDQEGPRQFQRPSGEVYRFKRQFYFDKTLIHDLINICTDFHVF